MKTIELSSKSQSKRIVKIDDEDYEYLKDFSWTFASRYAYRYRKGTNSEPMHRCIMERHGFCLRGKVIDHINGDGLDNRKDNLRVANHSKNVANRASLSPFNTSGFNGVKWSPKSQKWEATLGVDNERVFGGYHTTPEEAAIAYNILAVKHFREFAFINYFSFRREQLIDIIGRLNNPKKTRATSRYKGVCRDGNRWAAQATVQHRVYYIGSFTDERKAAIAFDRFLIDRGEIRRTNFTYDEAKNVTGENVLFPLDRYEQIYDEGGFLNKDNYLKVIKSQSEIAVDSEPQSDTISP